MKAISLKNVSKIYRDGENSIAALNNVSLDAEEGELIAIIGPSGSGKSTLLHIISGIDKPSSGEVYVGEVCLNHMKKDDLVAYRRRNIGLIYQFFNLVSVLTVEENIVLPAFFDNRKIDKERVNQILHLLDLSDRKNHFPNQLSGGQQQRVAIGRALYIDPAIILADEPTGNLDTSNKEEVIRALWRLNREFGKTVVVITHDPEIAGKADRIITIRDGLLYESKRQSVCGYDEDRDKK